MGMSTGGVCYATQALANDAYYSSQAVQIAPQDATHVVVVTHYKSASLWNRQVESYNVLDGYSESANIVPMANVGTPCTDTNDPSTQFSDGMILGWGVVTAMVAAYAVTLLRRAL